MRKELITRSQLLSQLRAQGISSLGEVRQAFMEGDGTLSVLGANAEPAARTNSGK